MTPHLSITDRAIDVAAALAAVQTEAAGAVNAFIGTVRNESGGRPVRRLHYESYDSMALTQLGHVVAQAYEKWPMLQAVAVNNEYASHDHPLHTVDEIALIPPVAGG